MVELGDKPEQGGSDELGHRPAETAAERLVGEHQRAIGAAAHHQLGLVLDDAAIALLAFFERALHRDVLHAYLVLVARAPDRGCEPRQIVFEEVIVGSRLEAFDGAFLAERARNQDERKRRIARANELQRFDAGESGQVVVGEHQVPAALIQRRLEGLARIHALRLARDASGADRGKLDFRIEFVVFQHQQAQAFLHRNSA